ncbi:MAG: diacylglycerol kinase family protein [Bacteroidetes bacterium]|nr:diacylglycerol kinase family protein [Bacteroidota bacterium]
MNGFVYAAKGLVEAIKSQFNIRFHFVAAVAVIALSFYYHLSPTEWCLILLSIAIVFATELLNTSIEYLTDFVSPEYNFLAGKVKDIAASAVLISAIVSAAVGLIIFVPKIF